MKINHLDASARIAQYVAPPVLVLTHTNAGAASLRARMARAAIPGNAYRISTLDGFAMRLVSRFPLRSGIAAQVLDLTNRDADYPAIRRAAADMLQAGHVNDVLRASYAMVVVDEYQDCNHDQHRLVSGASDLLPTCVLGDPMQAIFDIAGNRLVDWAAVQARFPAAGALAIPWRWRLAGAEGLGQWLLQVRARLQAGQPVDLSTAPPEVHWIQLRANTEDEQRRVAARYRGRQANSSVLVIGDARNAQGRHTLCSQTPGATVVERVDMPELMQFARNFDPGGANPLRQVIEFAASTMTGVGAAALLNRVQVLQRGRPRNPPTLAETAAVTFANAPSLAEALKLLQVLQAQAGTYAFRPELLRGCLSALQAAATGKSTLLAAAIQARERGRHMSRPLSRRSVGSTLLLKGLEADVAVILDPQAMNAPNLYVALTRGARDLAICSPTALLTPAIAA